MKKTPRLIIAGIVIGALLILCPIIVAIIGLKQAYNTLSSTGIGDANLLSHAIGTTMASTFFGVILCPPGIAILILSLVFYYKSRRTTPPQIQSDLQS